MIFRVVISEELKAKILLAKENDAKIQQEFKDVPDNVRERNIIAGYDKIIDELLGHGSAEKIFSGREPDGLERIAVFIYICSEITAHINKIKQAAIEE
jgi:hypothetical protein